MVTVRSRLLGGFLAIVASLVVPRAATSRSPATEGHASIVAAENALRAADTDFARDLLATLLGEASLPLKLRVPATRLSGDVEMAGTRVYPAELFYREALRAGAAEPIRFADELVKAHCGLATLASLHGETTASEAELRLAERHLGAASDDARATFHETVAATLVTRSCGYPCRVAFDGIDSPPRDAEKAAEKAIEIRRRLDPGSEGYALRLRARAVLGIHGAAREEIQSAHWDLLEAVRLLSREGEPEARLAFAREKPHGREEVPMS